MLAKIFISTLMLIALNASASAKCTILTSDNHTAPDMADGINTLLTTTPSCPKEVFAFRQLINDANLTSSPTMVANRGFHNPGEGSFSFFEIVTGRLLETEIKSGDFFFGHFTTVNEHDELTADQTPVMNSLMIEAFAWDPNKEVFNFYELRGNGSEGQWFYRGDSADIYADNQLLHLQSDAEHPQFGARLRCSGCHVAGGPIMKELQKPHNDWWTPERKLDFAGRKFDSSIKGIMQNLAPPSRLAESVVLGMQRLEGSIKLNDKANLSLPEKLRPLFCPLEINFESDEKPNDEQQPVTIPLGFFINEILLNDPPPSFVISRNEYETILRNNNSRFPETSRTDADHAWLTPVKARSDQMAIIHLMKTNLIDAKFVTDVLSIDMTNPIFSSSRCGLLKYVPANWSHDWRIKFKNNLRAANQPAAKELLQHLEDSTHTPFYHQKNAERFLAACRAKLNNSEFTAKLFSLLAQRRAEIKSSEISKNPRGQILEPGFRVIFPEIANPPVPGYLTLTLNCDIKKMK